MQAWTLCSPEQVLAVLAGVLTLCNGVGRRPIVTTSLALGLGTLNEAGHPKPNPGSCAGEQCSAAAALGMLKFFLLNHQADFDVKWPRGTPQPAFLPLTTPFCQLL